MLCSLNVVFTYIFYKFEFLHYSKVFTKFVKKTLRTKSWNTVTLKSVYLEIASEFGENKQMRKELIKEIIAYTGADNFPFGPM